MRAGEPLQVALIQMRAGLEPSAHLDSLMSAIRRAAERGAGLISTPEMTNIMDRNPQRLLAKVKREPGDVVLSRMRALAIQLRVWIHIGSLALASTEDEDRAVNRSFLINQEGRIQARYDKIHLFDAHPAPDEVYAESETYVRGRKAVVTPSPWGKIGLTVCYDLRFPGLYRSLAQAGAGLILVPSAFSATTGAKHWEPLLRARAIETGAYIAAAAQGGTHADGRQTWGHSMIVDPDGAILDQAQHDSPAVVTASLDVQNVRDARSRIPAWSVDPHFDAA